MGRPYSKPFLFITSAWASVIVLPACADSQADPPVAIGSYALDSIPRELRHGGEAPCYPDGLLDYAGEIIPYSKTVRVNRAFRPQLREFEAIVVATAEEFYGRAPTQLLEMGAYRCRQESASRRLLSEHALGNALDVAGFRFGPLGPGEELPSGLPESLREGFDARIDHDWNARSDAGEVHRDFLRALAKRVIDRSDLFTVVLGPAYPGHRNHLHLDRAPYRLIAVF
jgi:hypothetical protein